MGIVLAHGIHAARNNPHRFLHLLMSIFQKINDKGASNDEILQIFRDAQKELIQIVADQKGGSFSQFQRQQIKAIGFVISKLENLMQLIRMNLIMSRKLRLLLV
jgi:hypothetical protein